MTFVAWQLSTKNCHQPPPLLFPSQISCVRTQNFLLTTCCAIPSFTRTQTVHVPATLSLFAGPCLDRLPTVQSPQYSPSSAVHVLHWFSRNFQMANLRAMTLLGSRMIPKKGACEKKALWPTSPLCANILPCLWPVPS